MKMYVPITDINVSEAEKCIPKWCKNGFGWVSMGIYEYSTLCPGCKSILTEKTNYCPNCGQRLRWKRSK